MSAQLTLDFARGEVAKLDKDCAEAFRRGSGFHPVTSYDMAHLLQQCWEFHRLHRLRMEARERQLHWQLAVNGAPANDTVPALSPTNDTVPARGAEPPHR